MKRFLYFLTADALKKVKYRAILLLPNTFIMALCMMCVNFNSLFGTQEPPHLIEIYVGSSILLLIAVFRIIYVDMH